MNTPRLPFFCYGTLRTDQGNYAWALAGRTIREQRGTLTSAEMVDSGGFPFVYTTDDPTQTVTGDVMTVADADYADIQRTLDRLEGFYGENNPANMYDRKIVDITLDTGETIQAYAYLTSPGFRARVGRYPIIDSGDWVTYDQARPRFSDWYSADEDIDDTDPVVLS